MDINSITVFGTNIEDLIEILIHWIHSAGYVGIFIGLFLESTIFPLPSELIMIPAGYLAFTGKLNIFIAILCGTLGSLCGGLVTYYFSLKIGYNVLKKYGKYIMVNDVNFDRICTFFNKHGEISTFTGRLLPVIRHLISIPAGLSKMNLSKFCLFTTAGSLIWMSILAYIGWFLGINSGVIHQYMAVIKLTLLVCIIAMITLYIIWDKKFRKKFK